MIDKKQRKSLFKQKYNFEDRNSFVFCYIMVGVPLAFFCLFWLYTNFSSIMLAFQDPQGNYNFDNFKTVFKAFKEKDMYGWNLTSVLGRTIHLWFWIYVACVLPGMFSSYILYKKMPGHYIFRVIFMIPSILGGIVWVMIMKYLVAVDGPVVTVAEKLGFELSLDIKTLGLLYSPKTAWPTIMIINIVPHLIGFNMIITGAYARIPEQLFEVGKLEGLTFISEFFRVAVPLVWQTVVVCMISNLAVIFTFDGNIFLYTKGTNETGTMGFYLYYLTWQLAGSADTMKAFYGYPAAIGVTLTVMTVPVVLLGKYVLERAFPPVEY